ncbi:MAG: hypothetical protein AAGD38_21875 [Acidobacteriota bacterium]
MEESVEPEAPPPRARPVDLLIRFGQRFFVVYFLLMIFPFPLYYVPGISVGAQAYATGLEQLTIWVGDTVFNVDASITRTGSGDTTNSYVWLFIRAVLSLVVATIWMLVARGRAMSARFFDGVLVYCQLFLASILLSYGWHKLMPVQFSAPGPDRLLNSFGQTSPMGLVWVFMGTSAPYQMFAGFGEVLAGLLLFWRRTRLLGAIIGAVVMANVAALNYCFDVPVKLSSTHYLLIASIVIARDFSRLKAFFITNQAAPPAEFEPFPVERGWLRHTYLVLKLIVFGYFGFFMAYQNYGMLHEYGFLKDTGPFHGFYEIESFTRDGLSGREIEDEHRWVRVGINGRYNGLGAVRANGYWRRYFFQLDEEQEGALTMRVRGEEYPMTYEWVEDDVLAFRGQLEGGEVEIVLRRVPEEQESLLTTRGFHWINEYPFNR